MQRDFFKVGDIVRYAEGPTALLKIDTVKIPYGGAHGRYWGWHVLGGACGAYHEECVPASAADIDLWNEKRGR